MHGKGRLVRSSRACPLVLQVVHKGNDKYHLHFLRAANARYADPRTGNLVTGGVPIKRSAAKTQTNNRAVLNDDIRAFRVRLIGSTGAQVGIVDRDEALREARSEGLDLVLIAPDAEPPVVKVMDYGKHLFDQKKAKAAQRKKQKQVHVKEMKFRPGTEEGDYQVKMRNLVRFLEDGDKAKVSLRFRGREMVHPEIGLTLLKRIEEDLDEIASVETAPKFEGRQMTMVLAPRRRRRGGAPRRVEAEVSAANDAQAGGAPG